MESDKDNIPIQQLRSLLSSGENNDELVSLITDLFPAIIYVYDADNRKFRYINRKVSDLLGYEWDEINSTDNDISRFIFEEDRELVLSELEKYSLLEGNSIHSFNCRFNNKLGEQRYFRTIGTVMKRNEAGKAGTLLLMAQDITEQVKSEQEKNAVRKIIDDTESMLRMGIWSWDPFAGKTEWSEGMYELMGYMREDLPVIEPDFFYEHVCKDDIDELQRRVRQSLETGKEYRMDFSINRKDGARLFITAVGKPVAGPSGQVIKLTGINRDISDQYLQKLEYKANKELQKQTERMLNYGIFVWDVPNRNASWSEGLYEIFELEKDEENAAIGYDWHLKHVADEDRGKLEAALQQALATGSDFEVEYDIITAKGNHKTVSTKGSVISHDHGQPIRVVGNVRDVSRVKQVENELQRNVRELNRSNKELEEFAYAASHDLQEPLRKITTFGSRLMNKFGNVLGDEGRMYIERMEAASDSMRNLIDNLLELSRVTRSSDPFEKCDLNEIVRDVLTDLELTIDETSALVQIDKLPEIEGIPPQLRQMFNNLIGNALKFRNPDISPVIHISSTRLSRKEKEQHLLPADKNYVQVDVADNGIGFDQEYEQRIFQIFQRLHGKSEYPGSGIGLAICKRIAERHNGQITARGKHGQGAVFSVILPDKQ